MKKNITTEELLNLEKTYDENLTFQPVINKPKGPSTSEKSETRSRIDELCKKAVSSTSALRRITQHRNSGASMKRSTSVVSSVESEKGGVAKDKSIKILGEKLWKEIQEASLKVLWPENSSPI
jgi:hypothetical protein